MGVRERKVENYLQKRCEDVGALCWKFTGIKGAPDRIVVYKGQIFFVELKTVDGRVSKHQRVRIEELEKHGAHTSVIYGSGAVDTFINGIVQLAEENAYLNSRSQASR